MKKGVTLIEVLFVLGIMAIILGLVMVLLGRNDIKNKNTQWLEELGLIQNTIHSLCDNQNQDACSNTDISPSLAKSGVFPSKWLNKAGDGLVDPYGSPIHDIIPILINSVPVMVMTSRIHNQDQCQRLLNYDANIKSPATKSMDINTIIENCEGLVGLDTPLGVPL